MKSIVYLCIILMTVFVSIVSYDAEHPNFRGRFQREFASSPIMPYVSRVGSLHFGILARRFGHSIASCLPLARRRLFLVQEGGEQGGVMSIQRRGGGIQHSTRMNQRERLISGRNRLSHERILDLDNSSIASVMSPPSLISSYSLSFVSDSEIIDR